MKKRRSRERGRLGTAPRRRGAEAREDAILDGLTVLSGYLALLGQESSGPLTARQREMVESLDRTLKVLIDLLVPVRRDGF